MKQQNNSKIYLGLMASLTLGLAPFSPEPHIWGKIKWIMGGAVGMQAADYFDFLLHGAPWAFLIYAIVEKILQKIKAN